MHIVSVPVARAPNHKPLYHLVFGTRSQHGLWAFGDSVARATQAWWDTLEEVEVQADPGALFSVTGTIRPSLDTAEAEAIPVISGNLAAILRDKPTFKTVDEPLRVFGDYYGQVREQTVRHAVKRLHAAGAPPAPALVVSHATWSSRVPRPTSRPAHAPASRRRFARPRSALRPSACGHPTA